jgi:hypothetical protein
VAASVPSRVGTEVDEFIAEAGRPQLSWNPRGLVRKKAAWARGGALTQTMSCGACLGVLSVGLGRPTLFDA